MENGELERVSDENSLGIGLHAGKEGFDYYREVIDRLNDRFPPESINVAERYMKRDIEIVARLNILGCVTDYDLVFYRVPIWSKDRSGSGDFEGINVDVIDGRAESNKRSMLVAIGEVFYGPEPLIPSLVRLEESHNTENPRVDFRSQPRDGFFKVRPGISKDEINLVQACVGSKGRDRGAHSLIQGASQIVEGIGGDGPKIRGQFGGQPNLSEIAAGVRVSVCELGVCMVVEKVLCSRIKFLSVFPSAIQKKKRAVEGVEVHGRQRERGIEQRGNRTPHERGYSPRPRDASFSNRRTGWKNGACQGAA